MSKVIRGDRIGKSAVLRPGCSATIFDPAGERVLLTRRKDNGVWCLPGGGMDPGESATEACAREVLEETGLVVRVGRLAGVYSTPHMIVEYPDGKRIQPLSLNFLAEPIGGELGLSDETTDVGYFTREEMHSMDVWEHHLQRIDDAIAGVEAAFVR